MTPEFKSFGEIKQLSKMQMHITQKIHGTNAQVYIFAKENGELDLVCGKRSGWCYPESDNAGFANFVHQNKEDFIENLGLGRHDGEWAGPGINSGEGLSEKTFVLFDHWRWPPGRPLPPRTVVVPVLYQGPIDLSKVAEVMEDLKANGSKLVPGFMRPEGIVVSFAGVRYKKVFTAEESAWERGDGKKDERVKTAKIDYGHLLQPVRLEKLLSRDSVYLETYPESLGRIVKDYVADLIKEDQIKGTDDEKKRISKDATGSIFNFIKTIIDENKE